MRLAAARLALLWVFALPVPAAGGELYSYVDGDGVMHFTNVPTDRRWRKVTRTSDVAGVYRAGPRGAAPPRSLSAYLQQLRAAAEKYHLPEELLRAVMAVESNYDPRAVSEKGAVGLMQLMPSTAHEMYVADAWDPAQNIEGGARYLRVLANMYGGDMMRTLAAYNAGPDAVRRAGGAIPDIPETREYVRKVVALYRDFKAGR